MITAGVILIPAKPESPGQILGDQVLEVAGLAESCLPAGTFHPCAHALGDQHFEPGHLFSDYVSQFVSLPSCVFPWNWGLAPLCPI